MLISWLLLCARAANAAYCSSSTVPSLGNSTVGTVSKTVGSVTTYTCNTGYLSSTSPAKPYVICEEGTVTAGIWSPVFAACIGAMPLLSLLHTVRIHEYMLHYKLVLLYVLYCTVYILRVFLLVREAFQNYCSTSPAENSGQLVWNGYTSKSIGSTVQLSCPAGYTAYSSDNSKYTVTCQAYNSTNGVWSSASGTCFRELTPSVSNPISLHHQLHLSLTAILE